MLGENLRYCRERNHLTPKDISIALGVTPQSISKWENEACQPSVDNLKELSKIYGVSVDALVYGQNPKRIISVKKIVFNFLMFLLMIAIGTTIYVGKTHFSIRMDSESHMKAYKKACNPSYVIDELNSVFSNDQITGYVHFVDGFYSIYDKNMNFMHLGLSPSHQRKKLYVRYRTKKSTDGYDYNECYATYTLIDNNKYLILDENKYDYNILSVAINAEVLEVQTYE